MISRLERGLVLRRPGPWRTTALFTLLALGVAAFAAQVGASTGPWLWNLDLPKIDYPLASFFHEALADGRLPLWNDRLGLGFPLYAEGQIGAFYPPNWLIFQLPPLMALDLTRVLHLALAGVGAASIGLRLTGSRLASIAALLVAILGGAIAAKLEWHNLVAAYGWMPWVLLPLVGRRRPTRRAVAVAGLLWGVQALAGHPNTWLLTGLAATVLLLATPPRPSSLVRVGAFGLTGVTVGAVQLIPTLVLTAMSVRSTSLSKTDLFASAATPFDLLGLGFANAFALPGDDGAWALRGIWYPDGVFALLEASVYVGLPVLALAAIGLRARRARPLLVAMAVLLAIPIVAAFQPDWWSRIPILNALRSPVRAYLPASLLLGIVATIGLASVTRPGISGERPLRRWIPAAVAVAALAGSWAAVVALLVREPGAFDAAMVASSSFLDPADLPGIREKAVAALTQPLPFVPELLLGVVAVGLLALGATGRTPLRGRLLRGGLLVLVAAPLLAFGRAPNPTAPLSAFSNAETSFVQAARSTAANRLLTLGEPGWYEGMPDQLAAAGVPDVRMFSSLNLGATERLVDELRAPGGSDPLRRAVGIDVVVTFDAPCPGSELTSDPVTGAIFCRDPLALVPPYWLPGELATPTASAGRPWEPEEVAVDVGGLEAKAVAASSVERSPGHVDASLKAPSAGWVWIDRAWWPGWVVTVDGREVTPSRAMAGLIVPIGAGDHRVEAALVPRDALVGLGIGVLGVMATVAWAGGLRRPRKRRTEASESSFR